MLLHDYLEESAGRRPDKTALVCADRRLTYAEVERQCNVMSHALIAEGLLRGDRAAICLENSVETIIAIFAALKAGGVFLTINPTTKADKLRFLLNDSRARVLITNARKQGELGCDRADTPHLERVISVDALRAGRLDESTLDWNELLTRHGAETSPPACECIDVDLAALIYTSGSTGNPKGVMMTHLNMKSACTSITTYLKNTPDDVILDVLPLSFDYGLYQAPMAFMCGATLVLERSFAYPAVTLQKLAEEKATGFPIVPTILAILLRMDLSKFDLSALRYVSNTGAALPTDHIARLRRLLPDVDIYSMYGLTECKRVAYLPPDQIDVRPGSVGKAMPNCEVYLVDDEGRRAGAGETGQLVVRGANVMRGYWERPEETERALKPGPLQGEKVLYTGDLFRMDDEGYLYFVGRRDDMIKSRGEKVSPKEVENVLYGLEGVSEAAVFGVDDAVLGQAIKAVVALKDGIALTEKQVQAYCAQRLEDFMTPKIVEFQRALPKNSAGKIDKLQLK